MHIVLYLQENVEYWQIHTGFKCLVSDQIHIVWHLDGSQMRVILKCMAVHDMDGVRKNKIPQICILSGTQYSILSFVVEDAILCV